MRLLFLFLLFVFSCALSADPHEFLLKESDHDALIQDCVNILNGGYCETVTDLTISGPDPLVLKRFYSSISREWRIYPERFLVIGQDPSKKPCRIGKDLFTRSIAFTGERSGSILPYSGWRNVNGMAKDPLKIDILNQAVGLVNSSSQELCGRTNLQNNQLRCIENGCELTLGDGTKRIYEQVDTLSSFILGGESIPQVALQMIAPSYYLLTREILPSGNQLFFFYDQEGNLVSIEMKNANHKILSWIHFFYEFQEKGCVVHMKTSDLKELTYRLTLENDIYQLTHVSGSHCISIIYEYNQDGLVKKKLPGGHFVEIAYKNGKVHLLKGPHPHSGQAEPVFSFSYGEGSTEVLNAMGIKTRYAYDKRFQLIAIEQYDDQDLLYRIEQKFWGKTKADVGLLLAKTISDGKGRTHSYRSFVYDKSGNVLEERVYGNLTGKQAVFLQVSFEGKLINPDEEECSLKTFKYSTDAFNLLTEVGDCKNNQTLYTYKLGTNLLVK
ncbi:MAG: hypothetical protein FJZ58_01780, partial [Chlamydiae bacterium]|nr:hypothetical protein [Chlamydiota bacterium]